MTKVEIERLARVEERAIRMEEKQMNMDEKLDSIEKKIDKFIEASEKKFITRLETTAIAAVTGVIISIVMFVLNIKEKL